MGVDICIRVGVWLGMCVSYWTLLTLWLMDEDTGTSAYTGRNAHIHTHSGGEQLEQILRQPVINALIPKVPQVTVIRQYWKK